MYYFFYYGLLGDILLALASSIITVLMLNVLCDGIKHEHSAGAAGAAGRRCTMPLLGRIL